MWFCLGFFWVLLMLIYWVEINYLLLRVWLLWQIFCFSVYNICWILSDSTYFNMLYNYIYHKSEEFKFMINDKFEFWRIINYDKIIIFSILNYHKYEIWRLSFYTNFEMLSILKSRISPKLKFENVYIFSSFHPRGKSVSWKNIKISIFRFFKFQKIE